MTQAVEHLGWDGGAQTQHDIWTYWDGEDKTFDIADLTGLDPGIIARAAAALYADGLVMDVRVRIGLTFQPSRVAHVVGVLFRGSGFGMGSFRFGGQHHPA